MSLRIAYMTGEYPRATDTFIQREVAALRQRGVHVETFSVRKPSQRETTPEQQAEAQRTIYLLPAGLLHLLKVHASSFARAPRRYLSTVKLMWRIHPGGVKALLKNIAYFAEAALLARHVRDLQLVHLHNHFSNSSCSVAMLAAEMGGFSFSFTMHGPNEFFEPHYWRLDEKIRRAKFVCCISHFARSQGMIFGPRDKWDRMHIVHCGVDPAAFEPAVHDGQGQNILFVGRLANVKGVPVLIDVIKLLKDRKIPASLTVAGDGPDRAELEAQVKSHGIAEQVRFVGYQTQAQVRELLKSTHVFAMASFAEGVPVVLMEAMAGGVPVVAPRIAGIAELVEDGANGYLVSPGDPEDLADKIARLLSDGGLRARFGQAGRAKVERDFNIRLESGWLCEVLTESLAGKVVPVRKKIIP